jgi:DNA replication and repair protein RecF
MPQIKRLQITNLRNLKSISLDDLSASANLFYGKNGSGKTSLLEAVSLLGLGRSFRSNKIRNLINHEETQFTIFAEVEAYGAVHKVGIQKNKLDKVSQIKINGESVSSAVSLAQLIPLQVINAQSFQLIEGSPQQRRQFLDWMVFHVKPEFIEHWRNLQRVTKQRNSMLKHDKISGLQLEAWNKEFIRLSEAIHQQRSDIFNEFLARFNEFQHVFPSLKESDINLSYFPGWNTEEGLAAVLESDFDRDKRDGFTHHGPHRADIRVKVSGKAVSEILSRGQEKVLICALYTAQTLLHKAITDRSSLFLIDDLLAELDLDNAKQLVKELSKLEAQFFVTGINKETLLEAWNSDTKTDLSMFHVKQGKIAAE